MSLKAFLLCAGEGTRFQPHTFKLPKPLIPFLNLPLCAYNFYLLKTLGVQHTIINIHAHPALLKKELARLAQQTGLKPPAFSFEESLLGSAGGLLKVRDFFKSPEPFFYLNGDSFIWLKSKEELSDFYSAHIQSKALVSFLVWPAPLHLKKGLYVDPQKPIRKGYIYANGDRVCAFSTPPVDNKKAKPYEFSGLALFSPSIFNKIEQKMAKPTPKNPPSNPLALHIFKDVLSPLVFKEYIRVHSVPKTNELLAHDFERETKKEKPCSHPGRPSLQGLDMNQLSTYLRGTKWVLNFLLKQRGKGFLQDILDLYTPHWRKYEGDNWFSATLVKNPPPDPQDILFCGPEVRGLNQLKVKNFAVLGEKAVITKPLLIQESVLGQGVHLSKDLQNTLKLAGVDSFDQG